MFDKLQQSVKYLPNYMKCGPDFFVVTELRSEYARWFFGTGSSEKALRQPRVDASPFQAQTSWPPLHRISDLKHNLPEDSQPSMSSQDILKCLFQFLLMAQLVVTSNVSQLFLMPLKVIMSIFIALFLS